MPRIGFSTFVLTGLYATVWFAFWNLISQRFAGNPWADAWAGLINVHNN